MCLVGICKHCEIPKVKSYQEKYLEVNIELMVSTVSSRSIYKHGFHIKQNFLFIPFCNLLFVYFGLFTTFF